MFAFFESRLAPTARPGSAPPQALLPFYWHYVRQARGLFGAMFVTGLLVALMDTLIPVFIGRIVALMEAADRAAALQAALPSLLGMAVLVLVGRPAALLLDSLWPGWLDVARRLDCVAAVARHDLIDTALVAQLQAAGMRLLSYTVNEPDVARRLLSLGVCGLISDAVDGFAPARATA